MSEPARRVIANPDSEVALSIGMLGGDYDQDEPREAHAGLSRSRR